MHRRPFEGRHLVHSLIYLCVQITEVKAKILSIEAITTVTLHFKDITEINQAMKDKEINVFQLLMEKLSLGVY